MKNYVVEYMKKNNIPLTIQNFIHIETLGQDEDSYVFEGPIPEELIDENDISVEVN